MHWHTVTIYKNKYITEKCFLTEKKTVFLCLRWVVTKSKWSRIKSSGGGSIQNLNLSKYTEAQEHSVASKRAKVQNLCLNKSIDALWGGMLRSTYINVPYFSTNLRYLHLSISVLCYFILLLHFRGKICNFFSASFIWQL